MRIRIATGDTAGMAGISGSSSTVGRNDGCYRGDRAPTIGTLGGGTLGGGTLGGGTLGGCIIEGCTLRAFTLGGSWFITHTAWWVGYRCIGSRDVDYLNRPDVGFKLFIG